MLLELHSKSGYRDLSDEDLAQATMQLLTKVVNNQSLECRGEVRSLLLYLIINCQTSGISPVVYVSGKRNLVR